MTGLELIYWICTNNLFAAQVLNLVLILCCGFGECVVTDADVCLAITQRGECDYLLAQISSMWLWDRDDNMCGLKSVLVSASLSALTLSVLLYALCLSPGTTPGSKKEAPQ